MSTTAYSFACSEVRDRVAVWAFEGIPNLSEWQSTLDHAALWLRDLESRGKRLGVVVDLTDQLNLGAEERRMAGQWRAAHMPLIANTCICASYVAPHPILRGAVNAVFWFARPVIPVTFKGTQTDAIDWVEQEVVRLGTIRPPA